MNALLTSPAVQSKIHALSTEKMSNMTVKADQYREALQVKLEHTLFEASRNMAAELVAKIERPRLIRCASFRLDWVYLSGLTKG